MNAPSQSVALSLRYANDAPALAPPTPANVEAEQAVLGVLLSDHEAIHLVPDLQPGHFYEPFHGRLFDAIRQNARDGRGSPTVVLAARFETDEAARELGGITYLGDLIRMAPPTPNIADYGREVIGTYTRRELVRVGLEIAALGQDHEREAEILAGEAEGLVSAVTLATATGEGFTAAGEVVRRAIANARARSGHIEFPTGLAELDAMLGGLNAGEATLLAARPGVGKTVAAQAIAKANAGDRGLGTCLFSLEMSKDALGLRLATDLAYSRGAIQYSGVSSNPTAQRATQNSLSDGQWDDLAAAQAEVARWPLLIDDRPGLTLAKIEAATRRAHARWAKRGIAPGPVLIDHLGKVRPTTARQGNMTAEMADLSAGVSEMAKRLKVPVVALVQLNRGVEGREDKRPMLSDLRQAGQLEEDARQVIFLYRPEYYLREPVVEETFEAKCERLEALEKVAHQLWFLIEKNSHGPRGQVRTFCDIACSAIRDWDA